MKQTDKRRITKDLFFDSMQHAAEFHSAFPNSGSCDGQTISRIREVVTTNMPMSKLRAISRMIGLKWQDCLRADQEESQCLEV